MTAGKAERGCRAACIAFLYLIGMLLIIAGIAAGVFTQTYPDLMPYLAIAAGAAILMGLLFVTLSALVCTREKEAPRKTTRIYTGEPYSPSSINNLGRKPDLILPSESATDVSNGAGDKAISDVSDRGRAEKDNPNMNSVGLPSSKKVQKVATSSPRLTKSKVPQQPFHDHLAGLPDIPPAGQKSSAPQNSRLKSNEGNGKTPYLTGTSSVSDFSSLAVSTDDVVFDGTPSEKGASKPVTKGRGRVPLTAFKHASKSVSDLDDDISLEPTLKPTQKVAPGAAQQAEHRLAVSCHNILSEEPVRVGIHHLRQREAATKSSAAARPPVPCKVTGIPLPGLTNKPKSSATSRSENNLLRQAGLSARPTEVVRPTVPRKPNVHYTPKSVPDLLDSSGDDSAFSSAEPSKKTFTVTVISRSTNPLPVSRAACAESPNHAADLEKCNMIGLPLSLPPRQAADMHNAKVPEGYTVRTLKSSAYSQPDWAATESSRSNTVSSEDSHGPFNTSRDFLLEGQRSIMETEI